MMDSPENDQFYLKNHDGFPQNHGFTMVLPHGNMTKATGCPTFYREGWNRRRFQHGSRGQGAGLRILGTRLACVALLLARPGLGEGIPMDPWFEMGKDRGTIWLWLINIAMV